MEKTFSMADQSGMPDNLPEIPNEIFDALSWEDVDAEALAGFLIKSAELSPGPDGMTVMYGTYPLIDGNALFALIVFFSDGETDDLPAGLHFQRAQIFQNGWAKGGAD